MAKRILAAVAPPAAKKTLTRQEPEASNLQDYKVDLHEICCRLYDVADQVDGVSNLCSIFKTIDPRHCNDAARALRNHLEMIRLEIHRLHEAFSGVLNGRILDESQEYLNMLRSDHGE